MLEHLQTGVDMLTGIKIEKLFGIFDYDIEFKKEGITILTGPNGYGKTTILKILDALASQNGFFFVRLLFKKIILEFSDKNTITLDKTIFKGTNSISILVFSSDGSRLAHWDGTLLNNVLKKLPFHKVNEDKWIDARTHEIYSKDNLFQKVILDFPELVGDFRIKESSQFSKIPTVYFISAQRLLRLVSNSKIRSLGDFDFNFDKEVNAFSSTIEEYAQELRDTIRDTLAKSSQTAQKLDSSFPRRLFDQEERISENEFNQRFEKVKEIQKLLSQYGLSDIKEDDHPTYKLENAQALSVYIEDAEDKLAIFHELLEKLNIFTEILNERRFTFKRIAVSKEDGFKFTTDNKLPLALGDLSSGEQQEVVLLYELLFKVKAGTLVLIDEPELSLHVVWQKQFLDDLFKIIELQKISIVVATHSPQIINNHWDLTVDLEELRNATVFK
jgi:predicted ATP-binding protein involved in virulence